MEKDTEKKTFSFESLAEYLKAHPEMLRLEEVPSNLVLDFSDCRKRFTEFYRIRVELIQKQPLFFWVRYLKNKPKEEMHHALEKQYMIMKKLQVYLENQKKPPLHFSCSRPVALLKDRNILITKECDGTLMNRLLVKKVPFISRQEIVGHFYRVGHWLALFHHCFKENTKDQELGQRIDLFKKNPGPSFSLGMDFVSYCHRDYSPRNIFVGPDAVEVIDFVGVDRGLPVEDLKFFVQYIRKARFNLLYSARFKEKLIGTFLEGYQYGESCV